MESGSGLDFVLGLHLINTMRGFFTSLILFFIFRFQNGQEQLVFPAHPKLSEFQAEVGKCVQSESYCSSYHRNISFLASRIANDLCSVHLDSAAVRLLEKADELLSSAQSPALKSSLSHFLSNIYFSIGESSKAQQRWGSTNTLQMRSLAAQMLLVGQETAGIAMFQNYTSNLTNRFEFIVGSNLRRTISLSNFSVPNDYESTLLALLLSEAQGIIKSRLPLSDLIVASAGVKSFKVHQRFYLAVGLAKLGLYDLSLRHVSLIATPWEAPLYNLRAKLIFTPVHASMRALAKSVDNFLQNGEDILLKKPAITSPLMAPLCNSFNDAALALQALPLLHLAGYSSPREKLIIGQSPIALPALLSEVFTSMCAVSPVTDTLNAANAELLSGVTSASPRNRSLQIGVVSGSFDGFAGRAVVGFLQRMSPEERKGVVFVAICFPTPRDAMTDIAQSVFDKHINLPSNDKSEAVDRIVALAPDLILFSDAGLDSRVFTLAHERIALYQGALWGWGGTIGIPSIDFYFAAGALWSAARCQRMQGPYALPQELFAEQVVLFEGIPPLAVPPAAKLTQDINMIMQTRFLLPDLNTARMYIFPGPVTQVHPEFDIVISLLLKNDPQALVVLLLRRSGRDNLPTTHSAIRHDLMHPANAAAAVHKLHERLRPSLGDAIDRVRVLPPLETALYYALLEASVAVLDPFPVGVHEPIINALSAGVPFVSAPALQECTNSHAVSLAREMLQPSEFKKLSWPRSPEEYVGLALQLHSLKDSRRAFKAKSFNVSNHGAQIVDFAKRLLLFR